MKKSILVTLAAFAASLTFGQGTLTPPGAPAPTMKTLDQVEPRIPISSLPYTITEPGSYYLTTNLTSTGHGVVITANGVTLDLMGFTLSGDGGYSHHGVVVAGAANRIVKHVVVRNGAVKNFADGIQAEYSLVGRFEHLSLFDNVNYGISLNGQSGQCDGNTVADCTISGNGNSGIHLDGMYGQCGGNTIANCTIRGNSSRGISLSGASGQCDGNTVANCTISGNADSGIDLDGMSGQCDGNTIADCSISENSSRGICIEGSSSGQCGGNTIANCTIIRNSSFGIDFNGYHGQCNGNTIANCAISENSSYGIFLYGTSGQCDDNTIADCTIRKNTDRGISLYYADGNRVDGNYVTGQTGGTTYGIDCDITANNLIIRNSCVGQTTNFVFSANDTYGPEVTASGAISSTNPWANFSR